LNTTHFCFAGALRAGMLRQMIGKPSSKNKSNAIAAREFAVIGKYAIILFYLGL
jgi:hypothetical protein